jgi:NO-binding membrane sensor protein with MHYT domain
VSLRHGQLGSNYFCSSIFLLNDASTPNRTMLFSAWLYSVAVFSVFLTIIISLVALVLAFRFRADTVLWSWRKGASTLLLGSAIQAIHYTPMAAASFMPSTLSSENLSQALSITSVGTPGIIVVAFIVLGLALLAALVHRR